MVDELHSRISGLENDMLSSSSTHGRAIAAARERENGLEQQVRDLKAQLSDLTSSAGDASTKQEQLQTKYDALAAVHLSVELEVERFKADAAANIAATEQAKAELNIANNSAKQVMCCVPVLYF
jgi:chromosome segregation ATPase